MIFVPSHFIGIRAKISVPDTVMGTEFSLRRRLKKLSAPLVQASPSE
jgi:hypothetical protein